VGGRASTEQEAEVQIKTKQTTIPTGRLTDPLKKGKKWWTRVAI
jgi:hypothetical protein